MLAEEWRRRADRWRRAVHPHRNARRPDATGGRGTSGCTATALLGIAVTALSRKRVRVPPPTSRIAAKIINNLIIGHESHSGGKNGLNARGTVDGPQSGKAGTKYAPPTWNELRGLGTEERRLVIEYFRRLNGSP